MSEKNNFLCIYCKSTKVIKHGKTSNGNNRYRCRACLKTWISDKIDNKKPDMAELVESYIGGRTYRELTDVYKSSPLRINQKIREFLDGCPNWEEYLDACVTVHEPRLVYLVGRYFSCSDPSAEDNLMFLALAIDSLSTMVIGYEIATSESYTVWFDLLSRMKTRGIECSSFMAKGTKYVEDALEQVYPNSSLRISYHVTYRDNELVCCLTNQKSYQKLINDAIQAYENQRNQNLIDYMQKFNNDDLFKSILKTNEEAFINRLHQRLDNRPKTRADGLTASFQERFGKFHMLRFNPKPLVNGWIARWMLHRLDTGFNRLAIYTQLPVIATFKTFSCGNLPLILNLNEDSNLLKTFVIEIATRCLQIPVFIFTCEMKSDRCIMH